MCLDILFCLENPCYLTTTFQYTVPAAIYISSHNCAIMGKFIQAAALATREPYPCTTLRQPNACAYCELDNAAIINPNHFTKCAECMTLVLQHSK